MVTRKEIFYLVFLGIIAATGVNASKLLANTNAYQQLDALALEAGTDKSSAFHDYMRVYAPYFSPLKNKQIKFLEIGIQYGNSVKLWENYFTKAELHFIDCTDKNIQHFSPRAHYHFLDQADRVALNTFAQNVGGNFDIIIDDGGHRMEQQIVSFVNLFPHVKSGGMYVIEDLHTSYWTIYGGYGDSSAPRSGPGTTTEFLKKLVDDVNYTGARTWSADHEKTPPEIRQNLSYFQENILSLHFYKSICIIIKR